MNLLSRDECAERLRLIFPSEVVEDHRAVTGPLAAAAVYVCLYVGALEGHQPIRPSMVLWMCDGVAERAEHASPDEFFADRERWYRAARRGHRKLEALVAQWGLDHRPWYADNSREPLRDETFREWDRLGAIIHDPSLSTTSPAPAWTLRGDFAGLFKPQLIGPDLAESIRAWQDEHLGTVGRARLRLAGQRTAAAHSVEVTLPNGVGRSLAPGDSSLILKGVIEEFAPRLLGQAAVLAVSESRRKIDVLDAEVLEDLNLAIEAATLLPDALLFDIDQGRFWFVEAVATDGEIHEARKHDLLAWAADHGIQPDQCAFLSAFLSRTSDAFRRRGSRIAWGTLAWFVDEPSRLLRFDTSPEHT